ncbi:MAG: ABC transporter permease [Lachnospiraceae bacterium]|nr:ABC transporter permease [Lachnospiraceae bacterium]MDE6186401.1 ABC transporter permease [Lachnospiraceae bacterium]
MEMYKLELKKIRLSAYLWAVLGIFASLLAMGILFLFLGSSTSEKEELFASWNGLAAMQTALTVAFFSIFAAVLAAKMIVDEYCGKEVVLLFSYPVSRRRTLEQKAVILVGFTATAAFVSNLLIMGGMYLVAEMFGITPKLLEMQFYNGFIGGAYFSFVISVVASSFMAGILSSAIGVISAVAGWKKRSTMTTIICSFIIVCFVPNFIAGLPGHALLIMILVSAFFILAAYMMYQALAKGIEEMEV